MKIWLLLGFLPFIALAKEKAVSKNKPEVHQHAAHVHGAGQVSMAFDGGQGVLEFNFPGESIVGFEYKAKSNQDKAKQETALKKLEADFPQMVGLDGSLACRWEKKELHLDQEGNHSDVEGKFVVQCQKSPEGTSLSLNFAKSFPALKQVDFKFLSDKNQLSQKVGIEGAKLELK